MRIPHGILTLTGAAMLTLSLHAQPFTFNDRDLLLVFRQTGSPDLEVNIGPALSLVNAAPGSTIGINAYSLAQLSAAFSSLGSLNWAVLGAVRPGQGDTAYPQNTLWLSTPRTDVAVQTTAPDRKSNSTQSQESSTINGIAGNGSTTGALPWSKGTAPDPVSNTSTVVMIPSSDPNSYTKLAGSVGNLNGTFGQGSVENTTPVNFTGTSRSDFYQLLPGSGSGSYLGCFDFRSDGSMTFTAVPEPGTSLLAGLGAFLAWMVRWGQRRLGGRKSAQ